MKLSLKATAAMLENGLKRYNLDNLPRVCLPEPILADRLKSALEWNSAGDPKDIEAEIRKPVPLFEFPWGLLELGLMEAGDDAPLSVEVTLYVKKALFDGEVLSCLSVVLPDAIADFMADGDERLVIRELVDGRAVGPEAVEFSVSDDGKFSSANISFWLDGKPTSVEKQWEVVGLTLGELVGAFGDLIQACLDDINNHEAVSMPG